MICKKIEVSRNSAVSPFFIYVKGSVYIIQSGTATTHERFYLGNVTATYVCGHVKPTCVRVCDKNDGNLFPLKS